MRQSFWEKRFPTLLGLLIIVFGIGITTYLTLRPQPFKLGAKEKVSAQNVRISNQTPNSFSISFATEKETEAQVRIGKTPSDGQVLFDDRDEIGGKLNKYKTHHFTAKGLSPSQTYTITLLSQSTIFDGNGGFKAQTAAPSPSPTDQEIPPIKGRVLAEQGLAAKDVLVFAKIEGAALVSTTVKSQGEFLIPLASLSAADLTSPYSFKGNELITIEVLDGGGGKTVVKTPYDKHAALGAITIGKDIDLTDQAVPQSSGFSRESLSSLEEDVKVEPTVLTPKDGDFLIDQKPLFQGKGKAFEKVEIIIESKQTSMAQVTVDANGNWVYQPDTPISPGKHIVTLRFFDGTRVTKVLKQQFEVLASGSQVSEPATPSPTILIPSPPPPLPTAAPIPQTATTLPVATLLSAGFILAFLGFLALRIF